MHFLLPLKFLHVQYIFFANNYLLIASLNRYRTQHIYSFNNQASVLHFYETPCISNVWYGKQSPAKRQSEPEWPGNLLLTGRLLPVYIKLYAQTKQSPQQILLD